MTNTFKEPANVELSAPVILGCHSPSFAQVIEDDRDTKYFFLDLISNIFWDLIGEKSKSVESKL